MAKEVEEGAAAGDATARGVVGRMGGRDQRKVEEDYELFLRDLEEDVDMRSAVNLYKAQGINAGSGLAGGKTRKKGKSQNEMDVDEGEGPSREDVPAPGVEMRDADPSEVDEEADFPDVKLDELLENFDEMTLGDGEEGEEGAA